MCELSLLDLLFVNAASFFLFLVGIAFPLYLIFGAIGLTGFRDISRYEEGQTFYYRVSPLAKIVFTITLTFVVATTGWYIDISLALIVLATYLTLRRGVRKLLLGSALAFSSVVGLAWFYAVNTPYTLLIFAFHHECLTVPPATLSPLWLTYFTPLWHWPSYYQYLGYQQVLTLQGLLYGFQVSTRAGAILLTALILIMTSTPSDILRSLSKLKLPVVLLFSLVVGMRTVPRIFDSLDTAVKVQFMRGYGSNENKATHVFYLLGGVLTSIVPAMTFLFRGARNTAISADTRAFRAYKTRTYLKPFRLGRADYLLFGMTIALIVLAVLANIYGFGRSIPYAAVGSGCGATTTA